MSREPELGATEAELIKARRLKLDGLRARGLDPFTPPFIIAPTPPPRYAPNSIISAQPSIPVHR